MSMHVLIDIIKHMKKIDKTHQQRLKYNMQHTIILKDIGIQSKGQLCVHNIFCPAKLHQRKSNVIFFATCPL